MMRILIILSARNRFSLPCEPERSVAYRWHWYSIRRLFTHCTKVDIHMRHPITLAFSLLISGGFQAGKNINHW